MTPSEQLVQAWKNPGRVPTYHYHKQAELYREWPTLAKAIEAFVRHQEQETHHGKS